MKRSGHQSQIKSPAEFELSMVALVAACVGLLAGTHPAFPSREASCSVDRREDLETVVTRFMDLNSLPGCAVCVLEVGQPVFCKGFGYRRVETHEPFQANTICPIASVTKTITGLAVLRLLEAGKLKMEDRILPLLVKAAVLKSEDSVAEGISSISVGDLLRQESGFGEKHTFFPTLALEKELGLKEPPTLRQLIKRALSVPLDFSPGTSYKYSNMNYEVLAVLIEAVSGEPYGTAVRRLVFEPLQITDEKLFTSDMSERKPNEALCYDLPNRTGASCLPGEEGKTVAYSYGGIDYGPLGIWCLSILDLVKVYNAFPNLDADGGLLGSSARKLLFALPKHDLGVDTAGHPANWYYSAGVWVNWTGRIGSSRVYFAHSGNQSGSFAGFRGSYSGKTILVLGNGNDVRYDMADRLIDNIRNSIGND